MKTVAAVLAIISLSGVCQAEEKDASAKIFVHLCGQANKPGTHGIPSACSLEELEKAVGGWTEFGAGKGFYVIRFPRREGMYNMNDLQDRKQEVLQANQLEKKHGRFIFLPGDIIYIPAKAIGSR